MITFAYVIFNIAYLTAFHCQKCRYVEETQVNKIYTLYLLIYQA